MQAQISCISLCPFFAVHTVSHSETAPLLPLMDALVFGLCLMQPTWLPHKMMAGIRLTFVLCAVNSTSPHFVAN